MIELRKDALEFSAFDVHPEARLRVEFQRTLRIPDNDRTYPLPPGLGRFPMVHVDDHADRVPQNWIRHGGVMLPMHRAEALWIRFKPDGSRPFGWAYRFAVKVAAGKINAVTGEEWREGLHRDPQDYVVVPRQPWLDGFCVERGTIRQFVAMPLGEGYTAEEQITQLAESGGLQIVCYPMKRESFERLYERKGAFLGGDRLIAGDAEADFRESASTEMGLAPGGRMKQEILEDRHDLAVWDQRHGSRCFVHLCDAGAWQRVTGKPAPTVPPTARAYSDAGLPWFEYYADGPAVDGSPILRRLKSVFGMGVTKGDLTLPENEPAIPEQVVTLREGLGKSQVREGTF